VDGDPLDVTTFFVLSDGRLQITVASMETPNHETAAIYGVTFQVNQLVSILNPIEPDSVDTTELILNPDGTYSTTSPSISTLVGTTSWNLTGSWNGTATNMQFSVSGTGKPKDMIIGPPSSEGDYEIAGGSFDNFNPYYWVTAAFDLQVAGLSGNSEIANFALLLGTKPYSNTDIAPPIDGNPTETPEPGTLAVVALGMAVAGLKSRAG
jgi:hypothetical protein